MGEANIPGELKESGFLPIIYLRGESLLGTVGVIMVRGERFIMKRVRVFLLGSLFILSSFVVGGVGSPASAKDTMEVIRDKDKTTYVIDSDDEDRREEERDKERAWQMLQNSNIWVGGRRQGQPPQPPPPVAK